MIFGWIDALPDGKNFGFIKAEGSLQRYFLHSSQYHGPWDGLQKGARVSFEIQEINGKPQATNAKDAPAADRKYDTRDAPRKTIEPYIGPIIELSDEARKKALNEISRWKLEARLDDLKRYFFTVPELKSIIDGETAYVIGRKGTGKTALVQYLSDHDGIRLNLVSKLSFKNFPFNELYSQENASYTKPNQYITIWKLIIYSAACKSIARSQYTDPLIKRTIEKAFPSPDSDNLGTIVGSWIAGDFGINVLGTGISVTNWLKNKRKATLQEKVENLEAFVIKHMPNQKILVLFDELDEDYKDIFASFSKSNYMDLLTSLFKAVQDVRSSVTAKGKALFPVIFLRDDIYDLVKDADKNKWRDLENFLEWNDTEIRRLLAYRLSKVLVVDEDDFDKIWYSLFSKSPMTYSKGKKEIDSFRYITMSTQGRPRDYINYLKECADIQLRMGGGEIAPSTVKAADKAYSGYLRKELIDEMHGLIPDIDNVLSIFSQTRKWILSISEFRSEYLERVKTGSVKISDPDFILRTLFYFSVIGNVVRVGIHIFKYQSPNSELNFKEMIVVHRGLMKSLQIV
ncbi:P-loop ATPase, Sll1717 family [Mesorhizobium sophorae]|uniref:P-loop ATPase, Sll1717 family n=1 Tax=Mesorhizobium sophorae TaxID=1300294 RepID=UPI000BA473A4|nr:cold shock domain-containing protein [Mesorhizobium sophorae]